MIIDSDDSQGLWLAIKLKNQGLKVGWLNPSHAYGAALYYPYFMGIFLDRLPSAEFEFLSQIYHIIKNPMGFSLVTDVGPIDYANLSLVDFYRHRAGMDASTFDNWLKSRVQELITNDYCTQARSNLNYNIQGAFSCLYPKEIMLVNLLEENKIEAITSDYAPRLKRSYYSGSDYRSKVLVGSRKRYSDTEKKIEIQDQWIRVRIDVANLWTCYPHLPVWTIWRDTEDILTIYDSFFILNRVFDDSNLADLYFKLPKEFQTEQERMVVARLIIKKIHKRLNVSKFNVIKLEVTHFKVIHSKKRERIQKKDSLGLFLNLPELRSGWSLNHHLNFESELAAGIQHYLKKMEAKGVYRD